MRELIPGSRLDQMARSDRRYPTFKVLFHNPRCTTLAQVATLTYTAVPFDATPFVEEVSYEENIGFETADNPGSTRITLKMRRHPETGVDIRRGLMEDGVIVQVFTGDRRVQQDEWVCIFTGRFRGRPGDDPGTPADKSEGLSAAAHGREESFLNLAITTPQFPVDTDMGTIANSIAQDPLMMNLTMDEVLFGNLGFESKHVTNQIVDLNCLTALYNLGFPVGKKPKFDNLGRLRFVDVNLDKPACRIYRDRALFRYIKATPNEVEVNNSVVIKGLSAILSKAQSDKQRIKKMEYVTGFFDYSFNESEYFSEDHSQRADNTYLITTHAIAWSGADYNQVDEFHGTVSIDCHTLFYARIIIFVTWLALQAFVATLDLLMASGGTAVANAIVFLGLTVAEWREILYVQSVAALAGLLWSMQFIGRGRYEIWGEPYEFVYQEIMVRAKMVGLDLPDIREIEYRNDFISDIEDLETLALEHLRREMLKNQTYDIEMMDDPLIEVDDIIEIKGLRFYVTNVTRTLTRGGASTMKLKCWLVYQNVLADAQVGNESAPALVEGYGHGYGHSYGRQL